MKEVQSAQAVEYAAIPGRHPLTSEKQHLSGTNVQREQEILKLHPDMIRRFDIGECCIISHGAYQTVRVAQLPREASIPAATPGAKAAAPRGRAVEISPRPAARAVLITPRAPAERSQEQDTASGEELDGDVQAVAVGQIGEAPQQRDDCSEMEEETPRDHATASIPEVASADDQQPAWESSQDVATTQPDAATPPSSTPSVTGTTTRLADSPDDLETLDL